MTSKVTTTLIIVSSIEIFFENKSKFYYFCLYTYTRLIISVQRSILFFSIIFNTETKMYNSH